MRPAIIIELMMVASGATLFSIGVGMLEKGVTSWAVMCLIGAVGAFGVADLIRNGLGPWL